MKRSAACDANSCSAPLRTGPFEAGVFGYAFLARRGVEGDEGIEVFGRAEGVRAEAGRERTPVTEICRKAGISPATYFSWNKKYAGLLPNEMQRLKALEDENARLRKIVADMTLDREMLQDAIRRKI